MSIKDLAVAYNGSENSKKALKFAIQMCEKHGAVLTGLYVHTPLVIEPHISRWMSQSTIDSQYKAGDEAIKYIEADFRQFIADAGFDGVVDWLVEEGDTNETLTRLGLYFDILLIGQFSFTGEKHERMRAENLLQNAGRPLMIVPNGYEARPAKDFTAVAWDGSRPAARALATCMLLLETEQRIDVVCVTSEKKASVETAEPKPSIIQHLARHGIEANSIKLISKQDKVGQTILSYCEESQADILVMGAYSRARLRENLFGGVTRHILYNMKIPVLLTH